MESSIDYKNIAGIFPFFQQLLGLYKIGQGLFEIAAIISEAVVSAFKELLGYNLTSKASDENQRVSLGDVVITEADRDNAIGSPVPRFVDMERQNAVNIIEPLPKKKVTSYVHQCIPVVITEEDIRNAIAYEPIFSLDDPSLEEPSLEMASSTWEKLKEPITKIAVGILYFLPVIGTVYSIYQLFSSCNTESLVKEDSEIVSKNSLDN
ncbi:MAG: hypothetical protein H0T62_12520 [Parachlamydiaceae bacterium]|nr:hypothetical protein [Parachlamydiaceae bacterium]